MTMEIDRDALLGALREVVTVVPGRTTIPILANVLMECADGRLSITATDLDLQATTTVEAAGDLSITLPSDKMLAAVQSLRPGRIALEPVANRPGSIRMKQGRGQRTLAGLPVTDFPLRAALVRATAFTMSGSALARMLDTTHAAQSTEETRYYLNGVLFHAFEGELHAAATDGHRLIRCKGDLPDGAAAMPDSIVGSKAVKLLRTLLGKHDGPVHVEVAARAITFAIGRTVVNASLIDGQFPDYRRVIPQPGASILKAPRADLVEGAAGVIAVIMGDGKEKTRRIRVDLKNGTGCEMSADDVTGASASELVAGSVAGREQAFGVNGKYFAAALGIFAEAAEIEISIDDPAAPVRITAASDPDLIAVVMPMRI